MQMIKMKSVVGVGTAALFLVLVGCSQQQSQSQAQTLCPSERPEMCTRIYQPVCALVSADEGPLWETRPSDCTACSDAEVVGFNPGKCPD